MRILVAKKLRGLYPIDESGEAVLQKIGQGEIVTIELKRERNIPHHRKFFAMLSIILQNQDSYKSMDDLLDVCKIRIGHCRTVQTKSGEVKIPKSISFAAMDQSQFEAFYDRAIAWVVTEVVPGLERQTLDDEVRAALLGFGD